MRYHCHTCNVMFDASGPVCPWQGPQSLLPHVLQPLASDVTVPNSLDMTGLPSRWPTSAPVSTPQPSAIPPVSSPSVNPVPVASKPPMTGWAAIAARKLTAEEQTRNEEDERRRKLQREVEEAKRQLDQQAQVLLNAVTREIQSGDSNVSRFHAKDLQYELKHTYKRAVAKRAGELWCQMGGGRHIRCGEKDDWREGALQMNFLLPLDAQDRNAGKHNVHVNLS